MQTLHTPPSRAPLFIEGIQTTQMFSPESAPYPFHVLRPASFLALPALLKTPRGSGQLSRGP